MGPFVVIVVAAVVAAFIKSIAGMGYPIILIPVLALFMETADAVVIVALSNLSLNVVLAFNVRQHAREISGLGVFLTTSIVGAVAGTWALQVLSDQILRLILAGVIIAFLVSRHQNPDWEITGSAARKLNAPVGVIAGLFQGAVGISGPVVVPWYLSQKLYRSAYIFAITSIFSLSGFAQIVALARNDVYERDALIASVALIPLVLVIQPFGVRLRQRISMLWFERIIVAVLIFSAVSVVAKAFL